MVLGISKCYPRMVFILSQPNFMRTLATMVEYKLLLASRQSLKVCGTFNLWHFVAILTWE